LDLKTIKRKLDENKIASQVFDNSDFGYYKVTIERPDRRKAQFTKERIATLRFDSSLREPMEWMLQEFGDVLYKKALGKEQQKTVIKWCEDNQIDINAKAQKKLFD